MATYILVDTANTFFRARHVVRGDIDTKVGMALHITMQIMLCSAQKDVVGAKTITSLTNVTGKLHVIK